MRLCRRPPAAGGAAATRLPWQRWTVFGPYPWSAAVDDRYDDHESSSSPNVSLMARVLSSSHRARGRTLVLVGAALVVVALLVGALAFYPVY